MSRIVCILDPRSEKQLALEKALEIARHQTGVSMLLVACIHMDARTGSALAGKQQVADVYDEYVGNLERWLQKLATRALDANIDVRVQLVADEPASSGILTVAQDFEAGLIVKEAQDRSLAERLLTDATDKELIRQSPQPILLARSDSALARHHWIVAVDPSHPDEKHVALDDKLLKTACSLAAPMESKVFAYHAFMPPAMVAPAGGMGIAEAAHAAIPDVTDTMLEDRRKQVLEIVARHEIPDCRVDVCVGETAKQLSQLVDKRRAPLVIAGAVSRGALERFVIGNTAERFLNELKCDLLIVKPDGFPAK